MENKAFTVTDDLVASRGQRFLNLVIDLFVQYIIGSSIGATIVLVAEISTNYTLSNWLDSLDRMSKFFIGLLILAIYYYLTEMYFSRTIAKYFTKTLVVMKDGSKPNAYTIIKRTLCRFIPFEAFTFLGSNARGWHDVFSNTYVVKKHLFNDKKKLFESAE
jgi:uncharacterized RDD family membrane protein YckC